MTLREADDAQIEGRGAIPAGVKHPASIVLEGTLAEKRFKTTSDSTYIQMCDETEEELDISVSTGSA